MPFAPTFSRDEQALAESQAGGDIAFLGVDMKTDPGLLQPGLASNAVNKIFFGGEARTRGGLLELINQNAGATAAGAALFSNPNSYEALLVASGSGVMVLRDGTPVQTIAVPPGGIPADVSFVQCFDQVLMLRGENLAVLRWDGATSSKFEAIAQTTSGTGTEAIPNAAFGVAMANRLFVPRRIGARLDCIAVSDALDYTRYASQLETFRINFGTSDDIVQLAPYGASSLIVFKGGSIAYLVNVKGDLASVAAGEVTRNVGLMARNAVSLVGGRLWFLGQGGIWEVTSTGVDEERFGVGDKPVSWPLQPFFARVNWASVSIACSAVDDERYYLAVPWDGATRNNAVAVFNFITGLWEGYHTFSPSVDLRFWINAKWQGRRKMWVIDRSGRAVIYGEQLGSDDFASAQAAIADSLTTRGYHRAPQRRRFLRWQTQLATWRPSVTITAATDGVNESTTVLSGFTATRTNFSAGDTASYDLANPSDNHDAAYRDDYSIVPSDSLIPRTGALPELHAGRTLRGTLRQRGHYLTLSIANAAGTCRIGGVSVEAEESDRAPRNYS